MMKAKNEYLAAKRRTQIGNAVFNVINALVLAFLVVVTVYPFWNTIAISFNDGLNIQRYYRKSSDIKYCKR